MKWNNLPGRDVRSEPGRPIGGDGRERALVEAITTAVNRISPRPDAIVLGQYSLAPPPPGCTPPAVCRPWPRRCKRCGGCAPCLPVTHDRAIADDFTGATDVTTAFRRAGPRAVLLFHRRRHRVAATTPPSWRSNPHHRRRRRGCAVTARPAPATRQRRRAVRQILLDL